MNRFAKGIALCLVLLMSLSLFGCTEKPPATIAPIPGWDDGSSWVLSRYQGGVLSDEGYYYANNGMLYFADTSNGIEVCLCSKPGCLHEKGTPEEQEDCDANLNGSAFMPMFFWNDHLFYVIQDLYGTHVYRRNADGTAQAVVADLGTQYTKERKNVELFYYVHWGDCLYYTAMVQSVVVSEEAEASVVDMTYIGRLNLKTNKEEILLELEHESLTLNAVCPEGLLFSYYEDAEIDYEDENYRDQLHKTPSYVQFYDFETKEITTILSRTYQEISGVRAVRSSKIYYPRSIGYHYEVWEYDMTTGNDRKVCVDDKDVQIDGRLVIKNVDGVSVLYYLPAGEFLPTAFAGERLGVDTVSDDAAILKRTLFEGGRSTRTVYCYVKLADLADGLQEEDALDLYTYYYSKAPSSYEEMLDQMGG